MQPVRTLGARCINVPCSLLFRQLCCGPGRRRRSARLLRAEPRSGANVVDFDDFWDDWLAQLVRRTITTNLRPNTGRTGPVRLRPILCRCLGTIRIGRWGNSARKKKQACLSECGMAARDVNPAPQVATKNEFADANWAWRAPTPRRTEIGITRRNLSGGGNSRRTVIIPCASGE